MFRWLKIFLCLVVLALLALGTLPWWLESALRPILRAQNISFERYERLGYAAFELHGAQYTHPSVTITAAEIHADTPAVWLFKRLRGKEPLITVEHWLIRPTPSSVPDKPDAKKQINGMADLQRLLIRLVPILHHWLPNVHLQSGELRNVTPEMTFREADWHDSILTVNGFGIIGLDLAVRIAPTTEGSFAVTANSPGKDVRLSSVWSAPEIKADGAWWNQPVRVSAHYAPQGWLPGEAKAIAENWQLPASRVKLGAPYVLIRGGGHANWRNETFDLALNAKAEPAAGAKAPAFEAQAEARGNMHELMLTALHIDAPFATASLSAPVTFSVSHPLSASAAQLSIKADLSKMPWIDGKGLAQGSVTVTGDAANSRQTFQLEFDEVVLKDYALQKARLRGVLEWPRLTLEEFEAQLDKNGSVTAHGSINWETRELNGVVLDGTVGPAWFARWLPQDAGWATAKIHAIAEGSLDRPKHQGGLQLTQAQWKPLQPAAIDVSWRGTGTKVEITSARAITDDSTVELGGTLDPHGLQLSKFDFAPNGQIAWQLAAPATISWSPPWHIENLQLNGPASQATFKGKGGAGGFIDIDVTGFDSSWLQDWIAVAGPHWLIRNLQTRGHVENGTLAFDTTLAAQIEMQPRSAEVKLTASGDAKGVQLKELTVVESQRILTQATGKLPLSWKIAPMHVLLDETAPLELSASTEPDSPLWSTVSAYTGLKLTQPEARINLSGSLREPTGEVQIKAAQLGVSEGRFKFSMPEFSDLNVAAQLGRKIITLTTLTTKLDGQSIQASGQVPMDDDRWKELWHDPKTFDWSNATAVIDVPDADLAMLVHHFPDLVAPKGRLRAKVELKTGGKFSGELHLTEAASRPLPPFSTLQEINADLALADRTLTVQKLTAKLGGEPVSVDGSVTLVPGEAPRLALGIKGKNLPLVRNTSLLIRNDIDLHANTDDSGVTRISGVVTVRDSLALANLGSLLPTGQRGVTRQPPYFAVDAEPFRNWPLAVEVRGQQAIKIRTTVFTGTASARFQLSGTLGEPRAVGELTVDQGQVLFPFATFVVQTGTVRLREADPFHAAVNVTATSQRRDYQLRLEATGQLPTPTVVLSSTPALDAEEVLLMVMTGQPPNNTDITASSAGQRLALLGAYLGRGIFQDLGIGGEDRLEISAGEQVSLQGRETYEFEYKLGKRWALTGDYDRFDSYNAGVKWRVYTEESKPVEKK
jgi:translocation and assembly module TamB